MNLKTVRNQNSKYYCTFCLSELEYDDMGDMECDCSYWQEYESMDKRYKKLSKLVDFNIEKLITNSNIKGEENKLKNIEGYIEDVKKELED
jgi:hypothetical protein